MEIIKSRTKKDGTDIFDVAKYSINIDFKNIKNINFVTILQIDYPNRDKKPPL